MYKSVCYGFALVAEQVDAADLKSVGSNPVPVRFRPSAPFLLRHPKGCFFVLKIPQKGGFCYECILNMH